MELHGELHESATHGRAAHEIAWWTVDDVTYVICKGHHLMPGIIQFLWRIDPEGADLYFVHPGGYMEEKFGQQLEGMTNIRNTWFRVSH